MVYLMVRFTVPLHRAEEYDRIFSDEFLPVIREHGFEMVATFKTLVGDAGEYHELWRFGDTADFEMKWKSLFGDPRTERILARSGPLVRGEVSRLLVPASFSPSP